MSDPEPTAEEWSAKCEQQRPFLFKRLEIETAAACNRSCATCLRSSYPDRAAVESWHTTRFLPSSVIYGLIDQAIGLGFRGYVNLQHYNEPLLDSRIAYFGRYVLEKGLGLWAGICTNGDLITKEIAEELDGAFTWIDIALYMEENYAASRRDVLEGLFSKTRLRFVGRDHITNHFSPFLADHARLLQQLKDAPCFQPWERLIIDHRGKMLLCCDDMPGHFDLGDIYHSSLAELWMNEKHRKILMTLAGSGGRQQYAHCATCPCAIGNRPKAFSITEEY